MANRVVRYSEAFKLQVVSELESGALNSVADARSRYGIAGGSTVQSWLKKYGKNHLRNKVVKVETPTEQDQVKAMKKELDQLKGVLADTQVEAALNKAYFHVVCKEHGIQDPEAYKKKLDTTL